nr:hypothetical protein GCM10020063_046120 [Dactylosporangium thailandense]
MQRYLLALTAVLLAVAGCGTGEPAAGPSTGTDYNKLVQAVRCMRDHGYPDFPDPVEDDGRWVIPPPAAGLTPPPACLELFRGAKGRPPQRQLTADEIAQRRKWAECVRRNGIPAVPDPDSDGNFQLPPALQPISAQPGWAAAREACRAYEWPGANFDD